jgi:hypothetical protein
MRLFYACAAGDPVNAKSLLETTDAFSQGVVLRDAHHRGRESLAVSFRFLGNHRTTIWLFNIAMV